MCWHAGEHHSNSGAKHDLCHCRADHACIQHLQISEASSMLTQRFWEHLVSNGLPDRIQSPLSAWLLCCLSRPRAPEHRLEGDCWASVGCSRGGRLECIVRAWAPEHRLEGHC